MIGPAAPEARLHAQFARFALVGAGGFLVDESVLALMHSAVGLDPFSARAISILSAMTFTWWGNRTLTFPAHAARGLGAGFTEWLRYVAASSLGATLNYGSYAALVGFAPAPLHNAYLAAAIGVGIGMICNFVMSKTVVFRHRRDSPP